MNSQKLFIVGGKKWKKNLKNHHHTARLRFSSLKGFPKFAGGAVLLPLSSDRRAAGKGPLKTFPPASLTPARLPAGLMTLVVTCQWLRSDLCSQASLPSQNRQMVMWGQVVQMNFSVNDKHSQCKTRTTYFLKQKLIQDKMLKSGKQNFSESWIYPSVLWN